MKAEELELTLQDMSMQLPRLLETVQPVLQRGMIPLGAMPGVPYRNLGYVRLPIKSANITRHGNGLATVTFDISNVALPIKRAVLQERGSLQDGTLDMDTVVFENIDEQIIIQKKERNSSFRLCIDIFEPYLMRGTDGWLTETNLHFVPSDSLVREAPHPYPSNRQSKFVVIFEDGQKPLDALCRFIVGDKLDQIDIELKKKTYRGLPRGDWRRKTKWRRRRRRIGNDKNGYFYVWNKKAGIVRIRYKKDGHKPASPWTVFSFKTYPHKSGIGNIMYVQEL